MEEDRVITRVIRTYHFCLCYFKETNNLFYYLHNIEVEFLTNYLSKFDFVSYPVTYVYVYRISLLVT